MFEDAKEQLGNMNHREEQFAVGFMGVINCYLIMICEQGRRKRNSNYRRGYQIFGYISLCIGINS